MIERDPVTYTKTYTLMSAWAQTFPLTDDETCSACFKPLPFGEVVYYVTQFDTGDDGQERAVCWRHVHPDDGPR